MVDNCHCCNSVEGLFVIYANSLKILQDRRGYLRSLVESVICDELLQTYLNVISHAVVHVYVADEDNNFTHSVLLGVNIFH